jgi:HPt (histidine-containing phosphotransfer) domain-containing protein
MSRDSSARVLRIESPDSRGGQSTDVIAFRRRGERADAGGRVTEGERADWSHMRGDENLIYLAERLHDFCEVLAARIYRLGQAIDEGDGAAITDVAHALTDATARLGAVRMMKLCIALQMQGRRDLIAAARNTFTELEHELARFKGTLISYE